VNAGIVTYLEIACPIFFQINSSFTIIFSLILWIKLVQLSVLQLDRNKSMLHKLLATTTERNRSDSMETSAMDQPAFMELITAAVMLCTCIREVHGSLLGQDTQYPE
jgi:hypothetical protein